MWQSGVAADQACILETQGDHVRNCTTRSTLSGGDVNNDKDDNIIDCIYVTDDNDDDVKDDGSAMCKHFRFAERMGRPGITKNK